MAKGLVGLWLADLFILSLGVGKKPLFEYDDHYVMLNDHDRNNFYRKALARSLHDCGADCSVLDVGAGSGLLSMMAARFGAAHVLAIEANPDLAKLAERTVESNREHFPGTNVTVLANLSSRVGLELLPRGRKADVLVTETFGTMLLGEGAVSFVPDARDRLLKKGGIVIPAGGCQYVTLVEAPDFAATLSPDPDIALNLSRLERFQDNVYWKATSGASRSVLEGLTERLCVLEMDFRKDNSSSVPDKRTFRIRATRSGTVHAALFDWDMWADDERKELLSTASPARGFAGDVAWGRLLQLQEEADEDWQYAPQPHRLVVKEGDWLELGVDYVANGISLHARVRRAPGDGPDARRAAVGSRSKPKPTRPWGMPSRMLGQQRPEVVEANELLLPLASDSERLRFYEKAIAEAVGSHMAATGTLPTVLDCSGHSGVPALLAAKNHGTEALAAFGRSHFMRLVRGMAEDNNISNLVEAYGVDPRDLFEPLLPQGRRADIVVLEPPGTPVRGLTPFALLPFLRKHLLQEDVAVIPGGGCFEAGIVESQDLASLFSIPNGSWNGLNLTVWNEEARRQRTLERLVPYTKWFGSHSTMAWKWLSNPSCIFESDFTNYGRVEVPEKETRVVELSALADGHAHAIVARWMVWSGAGEGARQQLGAESSLPSRGLAWPSFVQGLATPGTAPGLLLPLAVQAGEKWHLEVTIRQGSGKVSGSAGPDFSLQLHGPIKQRAAHGEGEL